MKNIVIRVTTHLIALVIGFAVGIYMLPILTAPESPSLAELNKAAINAKYTTSVNKGLKGSDAFHWGEGEFFISNDKVVMIGELAPGPDYKVYLAPSYVETEEEFFNIKEQSTRIDIVKTFDGFITNVPAGINIEDYNTVVIWCEKFEQFITAGKYKA